MPAYRVDGQKRRFSNTISSCHTSYNACPVRLAIVIPLFVASSCGRAKTSSNTLRVEAFFRQWTKKSPFSKISGHVWKRPESVKKKQLQERVYNS